MAKLSLFFIIVFFIPHSPFVNHNSYALESKTFYYHTDQVGSVTAVSDENGNLVQESKYLPYGQEISITNNQNPNNIQTPNPKYTSERTFTGQIKDSTTNLSYYNARYYDPTLSRFISADSTNDLQNRFTYVGNNPIMKNDPSGNAACGWVAGYYYPCPGKDAQLSDQQKNDNQARYQKEQQIHTNCQADWGCRIQNTLGMINFSLGSSVPIPGLNMLYAGLGNYLMSDPVVAQQAHLNMAVFALTIPMPSETRFIALDKNLSQINTAKYGARLGAGGRGVVYEIDENNVVKVITNPLESFDRAVVEADIKGLRLYGGPAGNNIAPEIGGIEYGLYDNGEVSINRVFIKRFYGTSIKYQPMDPKLAEDLLRQLDGIGFKSVDVWPDNFYTVDRVGGIIFPKPRGFVGDITYPTNPLMKFILQGDPSYQMPTINDFNWVLSQDWPAIIKK